MFTLIGTILIVYVLWLVVKPLAVAYMRRKFAQKVNDAFRRQYEQAMGGMFNRATGPSDAPHRSTTPRNRRNGGKIFTRDDGEYVDFEEIECNTSFRTDYTADSNTHTPREPQVSDAEWEEI